MSISTDLNPHSTHMIPPAQPEGGIFFLYIEIHVFHKEDFYGILETSEASLGAHPYNLRLLAEGEEGF